MPIKNDSLWGSNSAICKFMYISLVREHSIFMYIHQEHSVGVLGLDGLSRNQTTLLLEVGPGHGTIATSILTAEKARQR